ncbi:MAG: hypothetical protein ACRDGA_02220 [Bacteroidota bacterium]
MKRLSARAITSRLEVKPPRAAKLLNGKGLRGRWFLEKIFREKNY